MKKALYRHLLVYSFALGLITIITTALLLCSKAVEDLHQSVSLQKSFLFKFTNKLCQKYAGKNVLSSPAAVHAGLSLVYLALEGDSANEMQEFLGYQSKPELAHSYASNFAARPWRKGTKFQMANQIFVSQKYEILEKFNTEAVCSLHSKAKKINFGEPILAANEINIWLAWKIRQNFKHIVTIDSIIAGSPLIVVNVISFEAYWGQSFVASQTTEAAFFTSTVAKVAIHMMHNEHFYKHADLQELNASAIEIPFAKSDIVMLVVLPKSIDGLADLEQKLNATDVEAFTALSSKLKRTKLKLSLPKFSIEFGSGLKDILKEMGLKTVFENANFAGLLATGGDQGLPLGEVIHQTFIGVDEVGIVTAENFTKAANDKVYSHGIDVNEPAHDFTVDHPFMFFIKDSETIYFSGHVIRP